MKMNSKIGIVLTTLMIGFIRIPAQAQTLPETVTETSYLALLENIASRSLRLRAAADEKTAITKGLRVGIAPDDPDVDFEYYFDDQTRYSLAISQRFDFPTVYRQRRQISRLGANMAEQEYFGNRRELMADISEQYLTAIYKQKQAEVLTDRKQGLGIFLALYQEAMEVGQVTILDFESTRILYDVVSNQLALTEADYNTAVTLLRELNGDRPVPLGDYPDFSFSGTRDEFVAAALERDYDLRTTALDTLIARHEVKLSRSEWIPKWKIGYKAEIGGKDLTNGILAGVSIPLWQNKGKVKFAKARETATRSRYAATESTLRARLAALYDRFVLLEERSLSRQASEPYAGTYPELLKIALDNGGITMITYLLALDEWYTLQDEFLSLEYEVALTGAAITLCLY